MEADGDARRPLESRPPAVYAKPPPSPAVWRELPPGPRGRPVIGNGIDYLRDPMGFIRRCYETYGRTFTTVWFGYPMVWLGGPEGKRLSLSQHPEQFLYRPAYASLIDLLGEGPVVTDGDLHERLRRLVLPVFQRRRMDGYLPIMWD